MWHEIRLVRMIVKGLVVHPKLIVSQRVCAGQAARLRHLCAFTSMPCSKNCQAPRPLSFTR